MIIIDTSAWINFFRSHDSKSELVRQLIDSDKAAICGPIVTEIWRGFKSKKEYEVLAKMLGGLNLLSQPKDLWEEAGMLGAYTAKKGFSIKSFDLLIAIYALSYDLPILSSDKDFILMKKTGVKIRLL